MQIMHDTITEPTCYTNPNQRQTCTFGVIDHPPLQHGVSVTGCSVTFNIEITGLTYVLDSIIEQYTTISKDEAVNWLILLGYKQENLFQFRNENREFANSSDGSNNCAFVSTNAQTNRIDTIGEEANLQQQLDHGIDELNNYNAELNDVGSIHIKHDPSSGDDSSSSRTCSYDGESDKYSCKKITFEKEVTEENASEIAVVTKNDEPTITYELFDADMLGDVETLDHSPPDDSEMEIKTKTIDDKEDTEATLDHILARAIVTGMAEQESTQTQEAIHIAKGDRLSDNCGYTKTIRTTGKPCTYAYSSTLSNNTRDCVTHTDKEPFRSTHKIIRNHTKERPYKCAICPYADAEKNTLVKHQRTDTKEGSHLERRYKCSLCPYAARQSRNLTTHIRTHTNERPYKCELCQHKFTRLSHLKEHMRTHTKQKPYKCTLCSYAASQKSALNKHMKTHEQHRPYKCTICPYATSESGKLNKHMGRHPKEGPYTKERRYKCTFCPYAATQYYNLTTHIRTHTNERPYKCALCQKTFTRSAHLKKHVRIHTKEKPYKCAMCSYAASQKCSLNSHMKTHEHNRP